MTHQGGPLLIVAGAGSGKTRVLTHRIAYLLAERHAASPEILAITFTNKAAGEMASRVAALTGPRSRAMWVMTFHSACVRILRREARRLGFPSAFSIYDQADSQRLMTLVARELELDPKYHPPKALLAQVSKLKNELVDFESFGATADGYRGKALAEAYAEYQRRLTASGAMDFDDLIMTTVCLLQAFPDVAEEYRRRFRHVLVDEYQDTNHAQYVLVRELVGGSDSDMADGDDAAGLPPAELCVVGDADQSIYAFRGATIRNITEFERDFPDARVILLEQNYRSTQNILAAANAVVAQESEPAAEAAVVRPGRRAAAGRVRRRHRARRGGVRGRGDRPAHRRGRGDHPARWRSSTGRTPSPGSSRRSSSGSGCPTGWSAASGSTSGARCGTCSAT